MLSDNHKAHVMTKASSLNLMKGSKDRDENHDEEESEKAEQH